MIIYAAGRCIACVPSGPGSTYHKECLTPFLPLGPAQDFLQNSCIHTKTWPGKQALTCKRLLAQQALRLAVQLLDHFAWQQAGLQDLHPAAYPVLHQAQLQDVGLLLRPARRGREVPPAEGLLVSEVQHTSQTCRCERRMASKEVYVASSIRPAAS